MNRMIDFYLKKKYGYATSNKGVMYRSENYNIL